MAVEKSVQGQKLGGESKKGEPKWLTPTEMAAWRRYIVASRRLLEALDSDLDQHDLSMADYEIANIAETTIMDVYKYSE